MSSDIEMQIRLQCLEMANKQNFHGSTTDIIAAAQEMYDFVLSTNKAPELKKAHGF